MLKLTTLINFNNTDGAVPQDSLLEDSSGDLFGTTEQGGSDSGGTVFEIPFSSGLYAVTPTLLANFSNTGGGGSAPEGNLIADSKGDLFGTTSSGGSSDDGTAFEIPFVHGSYASTPTILVNFSFADGIFPVSGLIANSAGDLFGTAEGGGAHFAGDVFEIPLIDGSYASTPTVLVSFTGATGSTPIGGLVADSAGDLFGTTQRGGTNGDGTVFEIPFTDGSYASTPTTLVTFNGTGNGEFPYAGLIIDRSGNLFGTADEGGANGDGTVFEIPLADGSYASTPTTLATFTGTGNGADPDGGLIEDAAGDLFGTTSMGGTDSDGTVFEIVNTAGSYAASPTTLVTFDGTGNGISPFDGLIADAAGDLFGTTSEGGTGGSGTAFEITGSGFVVSCYRRGTRIATPGGACAVESLAEGDPVLTASGEARPIVWIGRRRVDCGRHPRPETVWPVRVLTGAFGHGIPHRALFLSPDHAVFVDDALIPIKYLINGTTIAQVPRDDVTYYHVELASHDVLLAEGLPAESYLNAGDRFAFQNGGGAVALHPNFVASRWEGEACAPLIVTGAVVRTVRRRVNAIAAALSERAEMGAEYAA